MVHAIEITVLLSGMAVWSLFFICDSKRLQYGYQFSAFTTKSCPENQTQWRTRSDFLNCTKQNGYMCLPNEHFTNLLEFCYFLPSMLIEKGLCLFLFKKHFIVDAYNCQHFKEGCPTQNYRSFEVFKYPSCISIANGCFLADENCVRSTTPTYGISNSAQTSYSMVHVTSYCTESGNIKSTESNALIWIAILQGLLFLSFTSISIFSICRKFKCKSKNQQSFENEEQFPMQEKAIDKTLAQGHESKKSENLRNLKKIIPFEFDEETGERVYGTDSTVQRLPNSDADIKLRKKPKFTFSPLITACSEGHTRTVQLLLQNDADVNLCDGEGNSPLYVACVAGCDDIVQLLLKHGANVNLCNENGLSPLCEASKDGRDNIVKLLVNKGANINMYTKQGTSPLSLACQNGHNSIVKSLLFYGADINFFETKSDTSI